MTLKQLLARIKKTNELLKEVGIEKEYAVYIKEEEYWYYDEYSKEWLKEYIEDYHSLILNTEIVNGTIEFDYTQFKGFKDLEVTQHTVFKVVVDERM